MDLSLFALSVVLQHWVVPTIQIVRFSKLAGIARVYDFKKARYDFAEFRRSHPNRNFVNAYRMYKVLYPEEARKIAEQPILQIRTPEFILFKSSLIAANRKWDWTSYVAARV